MRADTVVLDGEMSLEVVGSADCELVGPEEAESGVFLAIREAYPEYRGPTEITPSQEAQTLDTTLKTLTRNIVVRPIPSNYGLITWNGSILTVS